MDLLFRLDQLDLATATPSAAESTQEERVRTRQRLSWIIRRAPWAKVSANSPRSDAVSRPTSHSRCCRPP